MTSEVDLKHVWKVAFDTKSSQSTAFDNVARSVNLLYQPILDDSFFDLNNSVGK